MGIRTANSLIEQVKSVGILSLGYCAFYSPGINENAAPNQIFFINVNPEPLSFRNPIYSLL